MQVTRTVSCTHGWTSRGEKSLQSLPTAEIVPPLALARTEILWDHLAR